MWTESMKRPRVSRHIATWTMALSLGLAFVGQARAVECPAPQKLSRPGVLRETQQQIATTGALLAKGDQTLAVLGELRKRYPGAESAEIVNYMIGAYCPIVAGRSDLSDADKQSLIARFVTNLMQAVY